LPFQPRRVVRLNAGFRSSLEILPVDVKVRANPLGAIAGFNLIGGNASRQNAGS